MSRAYLRLDPAFDERKADYPDGPYAALIACFCLAEMQPERGRFRSLRYLKALLDRRGRHVQYLLDHGDLSVQEDGRVYVDGWDEWQEGDWKVGERVARIRGRRGDPDSRSSGAKRTAMWRLRQQVFERDDFTCVYCGQANYPREWLVADHVVPEPDGPTTLENLVTACRPCNKKKGGRTPEQAGMPLVTRHRDVSRVSGHSRLDLSEVSGGGGADKAVALAGEDGGIFDAYYRLTARAPSPGAISWLNRLTDEHGEKAVTEALASEWKADPDPSTVLGRVQTKLADHQRRAEKAAEERKKRGAIEEQRDLAQRLEAMSPEERQRAEARAAEVRAAVAGLAK